ncbi:MAG: HD domain-containing protein [Oscillospiraceae bacterium]|jgi:tRNA nucleotidyltransferase (CCA-adding enzyme)|nr:HD domain-containing protein [Oscillospiraceae bacterium]
MILPDHVKKTIALIEANGYEAYVVGGCVRDSLLGLTPEDYDIATSAVPDEVKAALGSLPVYDTGLKHGTVTAVSDGVPIDITTFRVDGDYTDNRRPESVRFTRELRDDLSRRDFTVNAMAYSERTGIIDLFGGKADLENKIIRAVGDARARFGEDGLRILRALRFAAVYGFSLDEETAAAARDLRGLTRKLSGERIARELNKLILGKVSEIMTRFVGVFAEFIPEIAACEGFSQHSVYHDRDVLTHTLNAVDCAPADKITRLTLLFHDMGKPSAFKLKNGRGSFKEHAEISAEIARAALSRLKYDNHTAGKVTLLVREHDLPIHSDKKSVKRLLNLFGEETFFRLIDVRIADDTAKAEKYRSRVAEFGAAAETAREVIRGGECFSLKQLAVDGNDINALGYSGRETGRVLNRLLQAVISGKCENDKNALTEYLTNER